MNDTLTQDEFDALVHIEGGAKHDRVNACVGRNAKRLAAIKMITYAHGRVALADKGTQALLLRRCIDGMRALLVDPAAKLAPEALRFLIVKSHIVANPDGGYVVTDKGRESLADIDAQRARLDAARTSKRA